MIIKKDREVIQEIVFCCDSMSIVFIPRVGVTVMPIQKDKPVLLKMGDNYIYYCPFCGDKIQTLMGDNG